MLFSKKPSDLRLLNRNLSQQGRKNAQKAILHKAFIDSLERKDGTIADLRPDNLINKLKEMREPVKTFFKGDDLKQLKGLEKALKLTKSASSSSFNPPTGSMGGSILGVSLVAEMAADMGIGTLGTTATIGTLARLYESAPIRNLLIRLSNAPKAKELPTFSLLLQEIQNLKNKEKEKKNGNN